MCGRYTLRTPADVYEAVFRLALQHELRARYNIAPTQSAPVVRQAKEGSPRESVMMRWGLIPSWAKDSKIGNRMINARLETAHEKPAYRTAFRRSRCLVPADGFYEWKQEGQAKRPHFIRRKDGKLFAFAGLWDAWRDAEGLRIESFTILTTVPRGVMRKLHDRMPVIVPPEHFDLWLDPVVGDPEGLAAAAEAFEAEELEAYPVSRLVNSPSNDIAACIEPVAA